MLRNLRSIGQDTAAGELKRRERVVQESPERHGARCKLSFGGGLLLERSLQRMCLLQNLQIILATAASLALARIADGWLQLKTARVTAACVADHPLERSDPWVLGSELSAVIGEEGRTRAWRRIAAMFCWVPR